MNYQNVCLHVTELSARVANFIRNEFRSFDRSVVQEKGLNDLVSYVDKQAELQLVEGLTLILPEAGFIAEEGSSTKKGKQFNWIVDPLDGTTNFIHGLPVFAISIALVEDNQELRIGVVHEINRDECFYAFEGTNQAFCNGKPIQVSGENKLSKSLIATGFPYHEFDKMPQYLNVLNELMRTSHGLRRLGSAATDLAYVACGRFESFFEYNLSPWDVAAGAFIVQKAGGTVSDFKGGNDFIFGKEILAAGKTHQELLQTILKHF